jgi:hypothetical protein
MMPVTGCGLHRAVHMTGRVAGCKENAVRITTSWSYYAVLHERRHYNQEKWDRLRDLYRSDGMRMNAQDFETYVDGAPRWRAEAGPVVESKAVPFYVEVERSRVMLTVVTRYANGRTSTRGVAGHRDIRQRHRAGDNREMRAPAARRPPVFRGDARVPLRMRDFEHRLTHSAPSAAAKSLEKGRHGQGRTDQATGLVAARLRHAAEGENVPGASGSLAKIVPNMELPREEHGDGGRCAPPRPPRWWRPA